MINKKYLVFLPFLVMGCGVNIQNNAPTNKGTIDKDGYVKNIPELKNCRMFYLTDLTNKRYQLLKCNESSQELSISSKNKDDIEQNNFVIN